MMEDSLEASIGEYLEWPLWLKNYLCLTFFHLNIQGQIDGQILARVKIK